MSDHQVLLCLLPPADCVSSINITSSSSLKHEAQDSTVNSQSMWRLSCVDMRCVPSFSDEQEAVQKRTFTKWINSHLAKVSVSFHPMLSTASTLHGYCKSLAGVGDCWILQAHQAHVKQIVKAIRSQVGSYAALTFFIRGTRDVLLLVVIMCCSLSLVSGISDSWPVMLVERTDCKTSFAIQQ